MNKKGLLMLAAKAIGLNIVSWNNGVKTTKNDAGVGFLVQYEKHAMIWNPALNSGDSHTLQVTLKIGLHWDECSNKWEALGKGKDGKYIVRFDPDPKRAVLLVAAAIGEKMK